MKNERKKNGDIFTTTNMSLVNPNCPNSAPLSEPSVDCTKIAIQYNGVCPCVNQEQSLLRPVAPIRPSADNFYGDSDRRVACRDYLLCAEKGELKNSCE